MNKQRDLFGKTLVLGIIILFFGMNIVSSTDNTSDYKSENQSYPIFDNKKVLSNCEHLVYFGGPTDSIFECELFKGTLNDIYYSTCICPGSEGSGDFISGSTWTNDGRIIGCQYGNGMIYEIYFETCEMASIGGGGIGINSIAYDPISNKMYGGGDDNYLYEIDIETGAQDQIGPFGSGVLYMIGMAFDANGTLYGWDLGNDALWTIDTETGEATQVGYLGLDLIYAQDGDFCKIDDILYLAAQISSPVYGWYLVECDKYSGECNILSQFPSNSPDITIFVIPWNFPPYAPFNPYPFNGSKDVPIDTNLSWSCSDPDGGYISFDVYFGTNNPPHQVASNVSTYEPGLLDFYTTYYWKIVAWDEYNASSEGDIWCFTTERGINNPPYTPIIDGPFSGKPGVKYYFTFHSVDPDEDYVKYFIDWGDDTSDETDLVPSCEPVEIYHTFTKGKYVIKAKAIDMLGAESNWSFFEIEIPRTKTRFENFIQYFLHRLQILERLL